MLLRRGRARRAVALGVTLVVARQRHDERRSMTGRALDAHLPMHQPDQLARDPQSEPEAAIIALRRRALELPEDALLLLGRNANPTINDAHLGAATVTADGDVDRLALPVLDGIRHEVRQDLIDTRPIPRPDDR